MKEEIRLVPLKEILRPYTESMWRITVAVLVLSLMGLIVIGCCCDLMRPVPVPETDLRPRVRNPQRVPLSIEQRIQSIEQRLHLLELEQNRRQMVPVPMPYWTNGVTTNLLWHGTELGTNLIWGGTGTNGGTK